MIAQYQKPDLTTYHKLVVGEGSSDFKFFKAFCAANNIGGFSHAFTGMHSINYQPSGFDQFKSYLIVLERLAGFAALGDLVLVCDSAESADQQFKLLCADIDKANKSIGRKVYTVPSSRNTLTTQGRPRVHILTLPHNKNGGIETICVDVARDTLNTDGKNGTEIAGWVDDFADQACKGWTTEKRDKLRLQSFLSAAWQKKPDVNFSQLFDLSRDKYVPLTGYAFDFIRQFLRSIEAL